MTDLSCLVTFNFSLKDLEKIPAFTFVFLRSESMVTKPGDRTTIWLFSASDLRPLQILRKLGALDFVILDISP